MGLQQLHLGLGLLEVGGRPVSILLTFPAVTRARETACAIVGHRDGARIIGGLGGSGEAHHTLQQPSMPAAGWGGFTPTLGKRQCADSAHFLSPFHLPPSVDLLTG